MTEQNEMVGDAPAKKLRGPKSDIPGTYRLDETTKHLVRAAIAAMSRRLSGAVGLRIDPSGVITQLIRLGAEQVVAQGQAPHAPSQTEG